MAFRKPTKLCVLPTTVTRVPMWTCSKNVAARSRGIRTHPWGSWILRQRWDAKLAKHFEALDAQTEASTCQSKIALSAKYGRI